MPRHTTMKKRRVNKSGSKTGKRVLGKAKRGKALSNRVARTRKYRRGRGRGRKSSTVKRVHIKGGAEEGKKGFLKRLGSTIRQSASKAKGVMVSPLTTGNDASASRRLLEAIAYRVGFEDGQIKKILRKKKLSPEELNELGQIKGKCGKLTDAPGNKK